MACAQWPGVGGVLPVGGTVQLSSVLVGAGNGHGHGHANDQLFCVVTATVSGQKERGMAVCTVRGPDRQVFVVVI